MSLLVVLPFFFGDEHLLLKNLAWMKELDDRLDYDCLLACDTQTSPVAGIALAKDLFRSVNVITYKRVQHDNWPHQQNNAFAQVAWHVQAKHNGPWFWCETDCTPTRSGWLDALRMEYQRGGKPFGGHWNPETGIFNGVAIYPHSVATYSQNMMMAHLVSSKGPDGKPYQPPWDYYGSKQVRKHLHVMNTVMQHLWDLDGKAITFPTQESVQKLVRPEVVLFHRVKDGSLIDRLREQRSGAVVPAVPSIVTTDTVHAKTPPVVEIFIVTYWKDVEWLSYCLRSIDRFASGFAGVTIACPDKRNSAIVELALKHKAKLKLFSEPSKKGHLAQEVIKCSADRYCPNADYILHMDSDCVFSEPVTPEFYFKDGRPIMLCRKYAWLEKTLSPQHPVMFWKPAVANALGFEPEWETMASMPILHPRWLYHKVRSAVEVHVKMPFVEYVYGCKADWPYGFCEFNTLGAYAHAEHPESYFWHDAEKHGYTHRRMVQMWSHGGLDTQDDKRWIDGMPPRQYANMILEREDNIKRTDFGVWVLVNDTHLSRWIEQHRCLDVAFEELKRFRKHIPKDGTVLDVGACLGDHTLTYAQWVGPSGTVIGFETRRDAAECCRRNLAHLPWVQIHNIGLSDLNGFCEILSNANAGASSIRKADAGVPLVPLDDFCDKVSRCDFIKIDIEGHEPAMLKGAKQFISKFSPVMLIEVNQGALASHGFTVEDIYKPITELGYTMDYLGSKPTDLQFDILCIKKP